MAYPIAPTINYSYTGFAQGLGDGSFPGTQLDADLADLASFNASLASFLPLFVNSDGSLKVSALIADPTLSGTIQQAAAAGARLLAGALLSYMQITEVKA
ncbi:MAG: hypothetical protein ACOVN5_07190 [Aquidulcibacter sp.]